MKGDIATFLKVRCLEPTAAFLFSFSFQLPMKNKKKIPANDKNPKKTRKGAYFLSLNTVVYLFSDGK